MKIPTEEQINYIGKNLPTWGCEYGGECVPAPEVIEKIIIEWEKLKNQPKEVKEDIDYMLLEDL